MTLNAKAQKWLNQRAIDPELAGKLGIASSGSSVLKFPFLIAGKAVNHKYRDFATKRFWQDEGGRQCFWNLDALLDSTLAKLPLIITEGELDTVAAIQAGQARAVSVPDGAPSSSIDGDSRKYQFVNDVLAQLKACDRVILATDNDPPGRILAEDLAVRIGKSRCCTVTYPEHCKDLADVMLWHGPQAINDLLAAARYWNVPGLHLMSELPPIERRRAYSTGIEVLDPLFKIRLGDFSVCTGIPGHGKSTLVQDIAARIAAKHAWRICLASFESQPQTDHKHWLRSWRLGTSAFLASPSELIDIDQWIDDHFVWVITDEEQDICDLPWLLQMIDASVVRYGARLVIIDPWNELDHTRPPDMSITEYTGFAIKSLKRTARLLNVHIMVVAHPTKLIQDGKPSLYAISDSAHWANKCDAGLVVWRSPKDITEVSVAKIRHEDIGKRGKVSLAWNRDSRKFEGAATEEELRR